MTPAPNSAALPAHVVARRGLLLALLTGIFISNSMDRIIIGILAEPIRLDLGLSDTQLGLLTGLVFALFYTLFGVPVGWLADRFGRIRVIVTACTIWSVCSAMGGLAGNFGQLALARIGVGIGEAGGAAPSYSLIAGAYAPHERGRAMGLYNLGGVAAILLATFAGSAIAARYGWRAALAVVSLPGVIFAAILALTMRAPAGAQPQQAAPHASFASSFAAFVKSPLALAAAAMSGLSSFTTYAMLSWLPAYMTRVKGMTPHEIETYFAVAFALAVGAGMSGGGFILDRWLPRSRRAHSLIPCFGQLLAMPFLTLAVLTPDWRLSLLFWLVPVAGAVSFTVPQIALIQSIAPVAQRGVFGAMFLFVINLIGAGLGPVYVGMISDRLKPIWGVQSLSFGLAACLPVMLIAAGGHYLVSRKLAKLPPQAVA
jgi:predicted MFS family arabinose efflux permease